MALNQNIWQPTDEVNADNLNRLVAKTDFNTNHDKGFGSGAMGDLTTEHHLDKIQRWIEGLGPNNRIIFDAAGFPSVMVRIPRFNWDPTNEFNSSDPHPAFVVNGVTKSAIWIAKYQAVLLDADGNIYDSGTISGSSHTYKAVSWPGQKPRTNIDFDAARQACANKNGGGITGWHLMTNAEWAAVALWCKQNSLMPKGNNNYGRDIDEKSITGEIIAGDTFGSGTSRWKTGSGGPKTSHDGTPQGIFDLNGNIWEWVDGLKLVDGKIYVMGNLLSSPTDGGNTFEATEANWYDTGLYIAWDGTSNYITISNTGRGTSMEGQSPDYKNMPFGEIGTHGDVQSDTLKKLIIMAGSAGSSAAYGYDYTWWRNFGERLLVRGGDWDDGAYAGAFCLHLLSPRAYTDSGRGFRPAFIE